MSMPTNPQKPTGFIQGIAMLFIAFILLCLLIGVAQKAVAASPEAHTSDYEEIDAYFHWSFDEMQKNGN